METIIIISLCIVCSILAIGIMEMNKEIKKQKEKVSDWKHKYAEELRKSEKETSNMLLKYNDLLAKSEELNKKVDEYYAKYNETLKKNKELLIKCEEAKATTVITDNVSPKAPEVKSARKPRKKKGENKDE